MKLQEKKLSLCWVRGSSEMGDESSSSVLSLHGVISKALTAKLNI